MSNRFANDCNDNCLPICKHVWLKILFQGTEWETYLENQTRYRPLVGRVEKLEQNSEQWAGLYNQKAYI